MWFSVSNLNRNLGLAAVLPAAASMRLQIEVGHKKTTRGPQRRKRVRLEVGERKAERGPQRRIGSIGGIGPKEGSMAKIGKGQKRAPETPIDKKTSILGFPGPHGAPGPIPEGQYAYSLGAWITPLPTPTTVKKKHE